MKTRILTITTIFLITISLSAQTKFAANYSVGIPMGETSDLFDGASWRGVDLDFSHSLDPNLAIGFSGGWQVFDDARGYVTETVGTETISGYRYNYLNSIPLYATGSYFFKTDYIMPYVSLGLGFVHNKLEEDIGLFSAEENAWQFSLRPEVGLDYELNYGLALRTSLRYHYVAKAGDLPNLSYLGITLGLVWSQ